MATQNFAATVDAFVMKTTARMLAVFRTAAQFVIEDAQTPTGAGGNLRVKTGFLRNSIRASTSAMPQIVATARPADGATYAYDGAAISLAIAGADLGDTLYLGWTAAYAGYRENKDAFARLAAQQWQQHVNRATAEAKQVVAANGSAR